MVRPPEVGRRRDQVQTHVRNDPRTTGGEEEWKRKVSNEGRRTTYLCNLLISGLPQQGP